MTLRLRSFFIAVIALILSGAAMAAPASSNTTKPKSASHVTESARAQKRLARLRHHRAVARRRATA
ncbi:MAG TPA: hypothetical protein VFP71_11830, partial [Candidatus Angelobacter sp.]|nr:hypothetical protein [Candidatus Angelobacter sp.]